MKKHWWGILTLALTALACNMPPIMVRRPPGDAVYNPTPLPDSTPVVIEDVPAITLDVQLYYNEHRMDVHQTVDLTNHSADAWGEVVFNVPIGATAGAFHLGAVSASSLGNNSGITPTFADGDTVLRLSLPWSVQPDQPMQIQMDYSVDIPPMTLDDTPPAGTTGWNEYLTQAGEWYPALVPYVDGVGWHTWPSADHGDPTVYPLADYVLNVRTDPGITVVSGGPIGVDITGAWKFAVNRGRGIAFLASNTYVYATGDVNGRPVYSYYLQGNEVSGAAALEIAEESLSLFEELFGQYPYDSLTVAQSGFGGGMEYSSLVTIAYRLYPAYDEDPDAIPSLLHLLVTHEVAHQWWYGSVGNDQVYEPWLDESLAFYSERLYLENYLGGVTDIWWEYRTGVVDSPHSPINGSIYEYDGQTDPLVVAYAHYGLFIHDLRTQMGDEAFFAFLQDYYAAYSGKMATGANFREMAQQHSTTDLTPLFAIYFK